MADSLTVHQNRTNLQADIRHTITCTWRIQ